MTSIEINKRGVVKAKEIPYRFGLVTTQWIAVAAVKLSDTPAISQSQWSYYWEWKSENGNIFKSVSKRRSNASTLTDGQLESQPSMK